MTASLPMWIVLGISMFLPFIGLGAAIRPLWISYVMAAGASLIWIYGLGLPGFLVATAGGVLGALTGSLLRRFVFAFRARRVAARTNASSGGVS